MLGWREIGIEFRCLLLEYLRHVSGTLSLSKSKRGVEWDDLLIALPTMMQSLDCAIILLHQEQ